MKYSFLDSLHLDFLEQMRERLISFYEPHVALDGGGFAWLGEDGEPLAEKGSQLWIGARMTHVFALAHLLGQPGAKALAQHGVDFYAGGPGQDKEFGGWFAQVGGDTPSDRKELYGQAHVLLAGSTAVLAGLDGGPSLVDHALELLENRYWVEADGACIEDFDRAFTCADAYRGQNANMHLTEALIACWEATRDALALERAVRIARRIAGPAASIDEGSWRLVEHFDASWGKLPGYNRDYPAHPFRPYGSQPGHWLEWAKLLMQLKGLGVDEPWLLPAAERLFRGAIADGWAAPGGFVYTVGWDGKPVVDTRFWWELAEGVGAARLLWLETGNVYYAKWYEQIWAFIDAHLVDQGGNWYPELDAQANPSTNTWIGRPDLYHAYQATLYACLPKDKGLAAWAATCPRLP
ncbi:MAG: AGE family epimerase/isomerase [Propionibacteriaceae bacterium]|jgi:sulfoquinovose isomerase|nr:AGE family epimerase/isomerase [Propionibacteriaceae bacterium]